MSVQTSRSNALEESEIFHILGNDRRRAIVQLLATESEQIDVSDVATRIAERESDTTPVPNNLYKSVYVSLQQTHLPQLEEDDVIAYDPEGKTIQPGAHFDEVLQYIDGNHDDGETVLRVHLAVSVLGLFTIVLAGLTLPVFSSVDPTLVGVLALLAVAASSLYRILG
ncbi:DUF7344 domain-containing protein [Halomontanus rarus]|uniref:DUF7344 domain-containing protein n=1 Tax=Halomontanus rarus TaxID=3034020 RepID=UPI0023E8D45E|nr:ArsR family transcriptional regulator [Halovivax sp. TS33]